MDTNVGHFIRSLRRQRHIRQSELADLAGLKQPNLSRIESGQVMPRRSTLARLADALGMSVADLTDPVGWDRAATLAPAVQTPVPVRRPKRQIQDVPIIETSGAFTPGSFDSSGPTGLVEMVLRVPVLTGEAFALRVPDHSMTAREGADSFHPGEVVIFEEQEIHSGDFALVRSKELATFRQVIFERHAVRLAPTNRAYPERSLPSASVENIWKLTAHHRVY